LTIYFNVELYNDFGGWGLGTAFVTINLVLIVIDTVLVILKLNPKASVLTTGSLGLLTTFFGWSSLCS